MRPKHSQINFFCLLCTNEEIHCEENAKQPQQRGGDQMLKDAQIDLDVFWRSWICQDMGFIHML
jgi:hypothetical protein